MLVRTQLPFRKKNAVNSNQSMVLTLQNVRDREGGEGK
jgi:hypothetical protein